jgi:hypothetical protein
MAKFIKLPEDIVVNIELIADYRPWEKVPNTRPTASTVDVRDYIGIKFVGSDVWLAYKFPFVDFDEVVWEANK